MKINKLKILACSTIIAATLMNPSYAGNYSVSIGLDFGSEETDKKIEDFLKKVWTGTKEAVNVLANKSENISVDKTIEEKDKFVESEKIKPKELVEVDNNIVSEKEDVLNRVSNLVGKFRFAEKNTNTSTSKPN